MARKPQYHVSGINLLSICGEAFRLKHLERVQEPRSVQMLIGSAVDRAVTLNADNKIREGEYLRTEDVKDIARDALIDEWQNGSTVQIDETTTYRNGEKVGTEEDAEDGVEASMDNAIDASVDLAGFHAAEIAPTIAPTHSQRRWVLDVNEIDIQVAGAIDIQEGMARIRDTKTSAKSPVKDLADKSLQLSMYALAVHQIDGGFPREVRLDYTVRTPKRKELKYVPLTSTRGAEQMPPLIARIENAAAVVKSGMFVPASVDSWKCSSKYCGFFKVCRYANRRPVSVAVPVVGGR